MATICASSSNHSPTLHTISLYSVPTKPSLRTLQPSPSSSHHKHGLTLVSDDSLTVAVASEAVALANAAAQAAREAASSASALDDMPLSGSHEGDEFLCNSDGMMSLSGRRCVCGTRRRKRRRRRKKVDETSKVKDCIEEQWMVRPSSSGYLTRREELEFSQYIKEGAKLEEARRKIWKGKESEPTSSQWAETAGIKKENLEKTLCGARESRERINSSYRRLVASIAAAYQGRGLSLEDLIQEGSIGLLRGAEKFDPAKGYKLSTYVYWWIKQAIIRAVSKKSRLIRLPVSMCEMVAKVAEANNVLSRRLGRRPNYAELADMVDLTVSGVWLLCGRSRPPISLDRTLSDQGSMTLQEIIFGPDETRPETMVNQKLMKQEAEKLLETLGEREATILRLYFGFNGEITRSFEEIGRLLNLSRERVRQIHYIALTKLRKVTAVNDLRVYMT
ncbi:hypothetical protein Scep_014084 [Stephania cephalantha]|uniref:RNA polymerase sigma-70 domain-containing protein n=1 Tax=Stephania cephalantha TaxID=152367 RepID=A0AAP0J2E9_9MAGN